MNSEASKAAVKPGRLSLFVFIDAFGWELVKHYSFLDDMLPVRMPLGTQFGYSSTCIPTILTGRLPREHGHFTFFARATGKTPFAYYHLFSAIPRFITRRGRIRSYMSKHLQRIHGITGYFQIYNMPFKHLSKFDYMERRDIFEPGGINGGCPTIFDHLRENDIPFHRSDWHANEEANLAAARLAIDESKIRFGFVYLAALDAILHREGKHGNGGARKVRWYEDQLRILMEHANRRYDEVRLFVFSDHGMTDTICTCPLMERVDSLGLRFGKDYLAAYDSTMARFWFYSPRARDAITAQLNEEAHGHILSQEVLARWGCDFPDNRYGDLIFLMDPGCLLCPSFMGEKPLVAMHGYDPEDKDSVATFMTNSQDAARPSHLVNMLALMRSEADSDVRSAALTGPVTADEA
ncbi:MAG: alkaline phosphatase family protein [Candidatus Hydrogenedentes bacterium]|nr:alkaline phosphatase family protein [Candidatus Hydrogenedentota bacterium]